MTTKTETDSAETPKATAKKSTATKAKAKADPVQTKTKAATKANRAKATAEREATIAEPKPYRIEVLNIELLDPYDSPTQLTDRYDGETIERYSQLMRDDLWNWDRIESYPIVFQDDNKDYWIGDGHHTLESAHEAELKAIKCKVYDGDFNDAKEYSFSKANRLHGLPITNSQKLKLVIQTIEDPAMLNRISTGLCKGTFKDIPSSRAIAQWLGIVSSVYIDKIWSRLIEAGSDKEYPWLMATMRIGLDGKRTKVKPPEPPKAPEPIVTPPAEPTTATGPTSVETIETEREYGDPNMTAHNATIPSTTEPAPTNSAPLAPIATYTGKAREKRIREAVEEAVNKLILELAPEIQFKGSITQAAKNGKDNLIDELLYFMENTGD